MKEFLKYLKEKNVYNWYYDILMIFLLILIGVILMSFNCSALNLTYQGDKRLCITENNGSVTCLQKGDKFNYDLNKDYMLELTQKIKEKNFGNLIDFFFDNIVAFGFTIILFIFCVWILYYFIVN